MTKPADPEDAPFLARWSRLKREQEEVPAEIEVAPADPPAPPKTEEEVLEELGLPDPDTLGPSDDFSGFMAKAVPERLRNRALRKLWLTNPVLANLDELVDYGDDFTDAATVIENLQTVYRVGKGMLPDPVEEPDPVGEGGAEGDDADLAASDEQTPEALPDGAEAEDPARLPDESAVDEIVQLSDPPAGTPQPESETPPPAPTRRMKFSFDGNRG